MVQVLNAIACLKKNNIDFFTGVPDSLLFDFCAGIDSSGYSHITAANEGNAVALAAGYHLATGKIPLIYMQNSGFGNALNPLLSLVDEKVYNIPVLFFIGYRGEPNVKDEPQHVTQGRLTEDLCKASELDYVVISKNTTDEAFNQIISEVVSEMERTNRCYAVIVKKGTFSAAIEADEGSSENYPLRSEIIKKIVECIPEQACIISTTGKTSRELFEIRKEMGASHEKDFLTVGSMGHASSIALGIAMEKKDKMVICLEGEGAVLMHMGALAVSGQLAESNFMHIVVNNGAHDSVGGQDNVGKNIDFSKIAKLCGYKNTGCISSLHELEKIVNDFINKNGSSFIQINSRKGASVDLGRPDRSPRQNKDEFMKFLTRQ